MMEKILVRTFYLLLVLSLAFTFQLNADDNYEGVTPGKSNLPPRVPKDKIKKLLTWPGFQMKDGGGSRFFLQLSAPVEYEENVFEKRIEIVLKDTSVNLRNSMRPLETKYFNTPVLRARVHRRGKNLVFVMEMKEIKSSFLSLEKSDDGSDFYFLYIDFDPYQ